MKKTHIKQFKNFIKDINIIKKKTTTKYSKFVINIVNKIKQKIILQNTDLCEVCAS